MLSTSKVVGFVGTANPDEARHFYEQCLGLTLLEDSPFALVFECGDTVIRVQKVESIFAHQYTALGWSVADISTTVQHLGSLGVEFQRFENLSQDELGIWQTPDGSRVAWFKDPDGNVLSVTENDA